MVRKCKTGDIGYLGLSDTFHVVWHHEIGPTLKFHSLLIYNVKKRFLGISDNAGNIHTTLLTNLGLLWFNGKNVCQYLERSGRR